MLHLLNCQRFLSHSEHISLNIACPSLFVTKKEQNKIETMEAIMIIHHSHAIFVYWFFEQIFTEHLRRTRLKQVLRIKHGQNSGYSGLCLVSHNSYQTVFRNTGVFYFFFNCWCSAFTIYDILVNILMVLKV